MLVPDGNTLIGVQTLEIFIGNLAHVCATPGFDVNSANLLGIVYVGATNQQGTSRRGLPLALRCRAPAIASPHSRMLNLDAHSCSRRRTHLPGDAASCSTSSR